MNPGLSVSLGLWQDRAPAEALDTARLADGLGCPELWIGEMATYDAFALATAIGARTRRVGLTLGPLAVTVRDPVMIATGVATVAALTDRPVGVALGTSSPVVVEDWHGRSRARAATALAESAQGVRALLNGAKAELGGQVLRTRGYRLRLPAPDARLTVAAFGPAAVRVAARYADRMVINLVSPRAAGELVTMLERAAADVGRYRPRVAVWVPAAVDPGPAGTEQLRRALVGYLAAPGYAEMFERDGFADLVGYARTRPHPRELLAAVPADLVATVGAVGDPATAQARIADYAGAGVDDVVLVPSATDDDPAGEHTLRVLATKVEQPS